MLIHAFIERQQTESAIAAVQRLVHERHALICASSMMVEFSSVLRRLVNQGRLPLPDAEIARANIHGLRLQLIPESHELLDRAWEIATRLGQSDTFDAIGYAVAEAADGEFWTCDERFTNAGRAQRLPGIRYFD